MQGLKTIPSICKKKILILNSEYPPIGGGAGTATANLARNLAMQGMDVKVITARFGNLPDLDQSGGFDLIRIQTIRQKADRTNPGEQVLFIFTSLGKCLSLLRKWKPDATWAFFGFPSGVTALVLKVFFGIPYIVSLRGGDVPGFRPYNFKVYHRIGGPIIKVVWKHAKMVIANSQGLMRLAQRFYSRVPIQVIPNGVDLDFFKPSPRDGKTTQILFVGRVVYQKGLDLLVKALEGIPKNNWLLSIVGDGSYKEYLHKLIEEKGLTQRIQFHGWCNKEELLPYLAKAQIFVNPSRHEGMPNAVLEAMACGLPIIATRIAGNEDLVQNEKNGFLVEPESIQGLQQALQTLINNRQLCHKMGAASRKLVEDQFSWANSGKQYMQILVDVAENN